MESFHNKALSKILNLKQASELATLLRTEGKRIGVAGGYFDLLHVGQIRFLQTGREYCDKLFAYVLNDDSARFVKGDGRPIIPFVERVEALAALECVDVVVPLETIYRSPTFSRNDLDVLILDTMKPDVYIRSQESADRQFRNLTRARGIQLIVLPPYECQSTTGIIRKIIRYHVSDQDVAQPLTDAEYMQFAIEEAKKSNCLSRGVGAALVVDGRVVARGRNQIVDPRALAEGICQRSKLIPISNPGERLETYCCIHAEQDMIIQAASEGVPLHNGIVYVMTAPCVICARMLAHARIEKLFYLESYSSDGIDLLNSYGIRSIKLT